MWTSQKGATTYGIRPTAATLRIQGRIDRSVTPREMRPILVLSLLILTTSSTSVALPSELFSPLVPQKIRADFNRFNMNHRYPQYTDTSGIWQSFTPNAWSSGFFPATLYALNERSILCPPTPANGLGMVDWLDLGRSAIGNLLPAEPKDTPDHDRAFLIAFLEELVIDPNNTTAKAAVVDFAEILADRFNPAVGCTRSSDGSDPYKVIIDVMMNLEILVLAANFTNNSTFYNMAISHANHTMWNHVRDDGSTWQLVEYDSITGEVVKKRTVQGYSDDSTWSRGQAWGIYGFANMFRLTGDKKYLETARHLADYFIDHIPDDGIVPWDFDAPVFPVPRYADSSAAFIASAALLLLARHEVDEANVDHYTYSATQIVDAITSLAWVPSWESLLSNATVNKPAGNAMTGSIYSDYYFIKVGNELISRQLVECPQYS